MNKFDQYKLTLTPKQKDLVSQYLAKVKSFVESHEIEIELYNDIEEMVFEKLAAQKEITDLKVVKILQEVGEPEVIFSDFVESAPSGEAPFYERLLELGWVRDNDGALFLGISSTLAKKIDISLLAVRLLLLLLFIPLGISAWLYILAGIVLPVVGVDYTGKTTWSYIRMQTLLVIQNAVSNLSRTFMKILGSGAKISWKSIQVLFQFLERNIFPLIRFLFFGGIAFLLSLGVFALLGAASVYFTHFSLENIDFAWSLPEYFFAGVLSGAYALFVFAVASMIYGARKKVIHGSVLFSGGIAFLIALFLGISTVFHVVQKYSENHEYIQSAQISLPHTGSYILDVRKFSDTSNFNLDFFPIQSIALEYLTGSTMTVQIKNKIYGDKEIFQSVTSGLSPIKMANISDKLQLEHENNTIFSKKVPFAPITRKLVIGVPAGVTLTIANSNWYYFENVFISSEYEKYIDTLRNDCRNAPISYNETTQKFVCPPEPSELEYAKQEYLRQYALEHFEEITPIKHQEAFKRKYYNENGKVSDWNIVSLFFTEGKKSELFVEYGDRSLDIQATFHIEETATGAQISNFKIENLEVNTYEFQEKYYESIDAIKPYLPSEKY